MPLMRYDDALARVLEAAHRARLPAETVAADDADRRILAEDLVAPFDVPGFDHAAMDGYAIGEPDDASVTFDVAGRVLAGDAPFRRLNAGEAVQIATGAMLPEGAVRVVPVEASERDGERVRLRFGPDAPRHIRGRDDDYRAADVALAAGQRVGFAALGAAASFGSGTLRVSALPRVSIMMTGSELVPIGVARAPGRIHDSNGAVLRALLRTDAIVARSHGPLPDDAATWRRSLSDACAQSDVVITTGGASAGEADFMPGLLRELGEVIVWKVAMRPGMPFLFARVGRTLVFGLPGNPVAVVAGFLSLVRPALCVMQGAAVPPLERARLAQALSKSHDRLEFRRALLAIDADGGAGVDVHPSLSSGVLRSVVETNALVLLDADRREWRAGEVVDVLRYPAA
jgi:molybdopterin molybdotransferase